MTDAPVLARRFYRKTGVTKADGGFGVALDARTLRTPAGVVASVPTRALAELCAAEWAAQGEHVIPASMPVSQFVFATLDWTAKKRDDLIRYIVSFGETDLCCHRADAPAELVTRQARAWDPIIAWAADELGLVLPVVTGVLAASVPPESIEMLRGHAGACDDFQLTALAQAAGLAGSVLIAFALLRGRLTPQEAFEAAALDYLWSLEKWGEDAEARARLDHHRSDFEALGRFVEALEA